MRLLSQIFNELQETALKNIANDILQLHFHQVAKDEDLKFYYGGASVDREALIEDTRSKLEVDQFMLNFLINNLPQIKILYGTKNPTGDLGLPPRPGTRHIDIEGSEHKDVRKNDEGKSRQSFDN